MKLNYQELLPHVIAVAKEAGAAIMPLYDQENFKVTLKPDDSPLTEADLLANDIISKGLKSLTPDLPLLSEEGGDIPFVERRQWETYWLIDPLDGTNEFIRHSGEFTVNIALVHNHEPVLGVSYAVALKKCYYAARNGGAFCELPDGTIKHLQTRKMVDNKKIEIVVSRKLGAEGLDEVLTHLPNYEVTQFGGSLKICLVAEGLFDLYPRLGFNYEWDTAAGHCIVQEAGGMLVDFNFKPLRYNTKDSLYNPHFMVIADSSYTWSKYFNS